MGGPFGRCHESGEVGPLNRRFSMRDPEVRLLEERACVAVRLTRPTAGIDVGALVGAHLESLAVRTVDLGLTIAGPPYVRYQQWGGALAVLELGFPTGPEPPATK